VTVDIVPATAGEAVGSLHGIGLLFLLGVLLLAAGWLMTRDERPRPADSEPGR